MLRASSRSTAPSLRTSPAPVRASAWRGMFRPIPAVARVGELHPKGGGRPDVRTLKPLKERRISSRRSHRPPAAQSFQQRARAPALPADGPGHPRVGGRQSNARYQFTLESDNIDDLRALDPEARPGAETHAAAHRRQYRPAGARASRLILTVDKRRRRHGLGITSRGGQQRLYNAFGQRQVSTIYNALNQVSM